MQSLIKKLPLRLLSLMIPALSFTMPSNAVPAKPGLMTFDNGGKTIQVLLRGDEHSHFYSTPDGFMLLRGEDGLFRYAVPHGNIIKPSAIIASSPQNRSVDEEALLASFDRKSPFNIFNAEVTKKTEAKKSVYAKNKRLQNKAKIAEESSLNSFPTKGSPRCLAILVEFQDVKFTLPNPKQLFHDMLNKEGFSEYGASGSARDFFKASSGDQFTPQFDVYGPVCLPYNMSYYGSNDEKTGDDARPYEMVPHAVDLLKDEIDFSIYDTDDDGIVDNIYFFYAGYGEADGGPANSIWPHAWNIHDDLGMEIYMNGKLINHYATNNELADGQGAKLAGIGVFCHEFSHVLGLPDLYSTLYTSAFTPGNWSLMDHGSYNNDGHTPPYHTGYERYCLGWVEPKVLSEPSNITMYPVSQIGAYNDVYMIETPKKQEYYILENRQNKGWDEYIPGHGLLVWHIDFEPEKWLLNIVNIDINKQYVDIVEADNEQSSFSITGDTFPGTSGVTEFTDNTTPSMKTWDGIALHSPITDIKDINGIVSFAFKGGHNIFDDITALEPNKIKAGGFTAAWNEISRTTGYLLSVYTKENGAKKYLDGYLKREVGAVNEFEVTGLTPSTTYYYVVTGTNGRFYSTESNEIEVTTLAPTLDYKSVKTLPASEIGETSFRANWEALEDAERYEVTLHTLTLGEPFETTTGFDNRDLPAGWQSDASYDGRASYATTAPSLRFTADGSYLTTAKFNDNIRTLSFWYRAASGSNDASIEISGLCNNEWIPVKSVTDLISSAGGTTVTIDNMPANITTLRFEFKRPASGSVSIDDITIGYGGNIGYYPIKGFEAVNAGSETSLLFENLELNTDYGYSVTAYNSEFASKPSSMMSVRTGSSGITSTISENATILTEGLNLTVTTPTDETISVTDISGITLTSSGNGSLKTTLPAAGLYMVRIGNRVLKIIITAK